MKREERQQLQEAYRLIRAKRKAEARALLEKALTANPRLVDGYWLYAMAASRADEARQALEIALELDPGHERARGALARLNARYPSAPSSERPAPPGETPPAPQSGVVPLAPLEGAPERGEGAADDEPPDELFPDEGEKPASAADIKLVAAKRRMSLPVVPLMAVGVGVVVLAAVVVVVLTTVQIGPCQPAAWLAAYDALMARWSGPAASLASANPDATIGQLEQLRDEVYALGGTPCMWPARDKTVALLDQLIDAVRKAADGDLQGAEAALERVARLEREREQELHLLRAMR